MEPVKIQLKSHHVVHRYSIQAVPVRRDFLYLGVGATVIVSTNSPRSRLATHVHNVVRVCRAIGVV